VHLRPAGFRERNRENLRSGIDADSGELSMEDESLDLPETRNHRAVTPNPSWEQVQLARHLNDHIRVGCVGWSPVWKVAGTGFRR